MKDRRGYAIITLVMVGRKSPEISPVLQDHQVVAEKERPPRLPLAEFVYRNVFPSGGDTVVGEGKMTVR